MSDDGIIDLAAYLEARDGDLDDDDAPLALRGMEGERRRFVLPLWRMAYLASASWAGLVRETGPGRVEAVLVLDTGQDPARALPDAGLPELEEGDRPPSLRVAKGGELVLALGPGPGGKRWMVVLAERPAEAEELDADTREDLLYVAGECAGLVELVED